MRNRVVREGFWNDEELGAMPRDARLLFVGLWAYADDWGRLEERPMKIRAAVFPYDRDIEVNQITEWIDLLVTTDKLLRYVVDGQKYLFIRKFFTYQQMRRHKSSTLPPPPGDDGQLRPPSFISGAEPTMSGDTGESRTSADIVRQSPQVPDFASEDIDVDIDSDSEGDTDPVLKERRRGAATPPTLDAMRLAVVFQRLRGWPKVTNAVARGVVQGWLTAYPTLDIEDEARKIGLWQISDAKGKRQAATPKFIESWLKRAMNPPAWENGNGTKHRPQSGANPETAGGEIRPGSNVGWSIYDTPIDDSPLPDVPGSRLGQQAAPEPSRNGAHLQGGPLPRVR